MENKKGGVKEPEFEGVLDYDAVCLICPHVFNAGPVFYYTGVVIKSPHRRHF